MSPSTCQNSSYVMILSDGVFCPNGPLTTPRNSSRHERFHNDNCPSGDTVTEHGDYINDDDNDCDDDDSFNLEDLLPGGKCDQSTVSSYAGEESNDDFDEDTIIENSAGSSSPATSNGTKEEALNVLHLSISKKMGYRHGHGKKRSNCQSQHSFRSEESDDDDNNNNSVINDFDTSSACLSYTHEEDEEDHESDPNIGGTDGTTKPSKKASLLQTPVRFSAGNVLLSIRRESTTPRGGARPSIQATPMSRISEHTRESTYNSSGVEDVSRSELGRARSNYKGGDGRSSTSTSASNNSFASSKMSSWSRSRFDAFSPSPRCSTSGRETWTNTIGRCDIVNIQDLHSLMLAPDD